MGAAPEENAASAAKPMAQRNKVETEFMIVIASGEWKSAGTLRGNARSDQHRWAQNTSLVLTVNDRDHTQIGPPWQLFYFGNVTFYGQVRKAKPVAAVVRRWSAETKGDDHHALASAATGASKSAVLLTPSCARGNRPSPGSAGRFRKTCSRRRPASRPSVRRGD